MKSGTYGYVTPPLRPGPLELSPPVQTPTPSPTLLTPLTPSLIPPSNLFSRARGLRAGPSHAPAMPNDTFTLTSYGIQELSTSKRDRRARPLRVNVLPGLAARYAVVRAGAPSFSVWRARKRARGRHTPSRFAVPRMRLTSASGGQEAIQAFAARVGGLANCEGAAPLSLCRREREVVPLNFAVPDMFLLKSRFPDL